MLALIVFWTAYAIGAGWTLYLATPPLSRDVLLILCGYGALLTVATLAILLRRSRS